MTERILGEPGPTRRRRLRLLPVLLLLSVLVLVVVGQAAGADPDSPPYVITNDENGPNDVPGQKDLNLHGIDNSNLANGEVKVLWNWDELGTSGNNSLDACSLFDTDNDSKANFAVCVTTTGNPATLLTTTVYTCGDGRVDRCSSQIAVVPNPTSTCTVTSPSATDPYPGPPNKDKGASHPNDTRAKCTIKLADVGGAAVANLINTCSYPSTQPNSDPSDCVLVPRDAFITIVKVADPSNQGSFAFTLNGNPAFTASGSQTSSPIAVVTANNATHSVAETVPSGWTLDSASCTGAGDGNGTKSGSTISGINPRPEDNITCTFTNTLQRATVNVTKSGSDGGSQNGAIFTLYAGSDNTGTVVGTCTVASGQCGSNPSFSNLLPGTYTLDETTVPAGYSKPVGLPETFTLVAGQNKVFTIVDAAQPGSVSVTKIDDAGNPVAGATFQLYSPQGIANGAPTGQAVPGKSCQTDGTGACTITGVTAGAYTIDETVVPTGYSKASTMPQNISVTNGTQTVVSNVTNPRLFKTIVIVCKQAGNTLYPSAITIDGDSAGSSLSASGATSAGLSESALCGLTAGAKSGLRAATHASNPHSASINIPNSQP